MRKVMDLYQKTPALTDIKYPVYAAPKLNGIMCAIYEGKAYSKRKKLIPNRFIQSELRKLRLPQTDGELIVPGGFNAVQSAVMSHGGEPDFTYNLFDISLPVSLAFEKRLEIIHSLCERHERLELIPQTLITTPEELDKFWKYWCDAGEEGIVTKRPDSKYKLGRTTLRENIAFKLKPVKEAEGVITGYHELMHNSDTSTKKQENLIPGGCLGAFEVKFKGAYFKLSGFDQEQRFKFWSIRDELLGKHVTFKYKELSKYGKPVEPIFKAIRQDY